MGGLWIKFTSPGMTGVPDRIAIFPGGVIVFVEVKTESGRISPVQEHVIGKLRDRGCHVHVVRGESGALGFINYMRMVLEGRR